LPTAARRTSDSVAGPGGERARLRPDLQGRSSRMPDKGAAAELEADNHALRQRVTRLEAELSELADTLDAARTMNRDLMTQLNRHTTAGPQATGARRRPPRRTS
jgi:septal ring factor EnvC (AmiA/AmiB activator)